MSNLPKTVRGPAAGRRLFPVALVALALAVPATALAYFLPLDFVLGKMAEKHKRLVDVRVEHEAHFFGPGVPGGRLVASETLLCKPPVAKRITRLPAGERIAVYEAGKAAAVRGVEAGATWAEPPAMNQFLAMVCRGLGRKTLGAWGIDTEVRSYHRYRDRIAYVVGASGGDVDSAQFWLDKDAFRPLRYSSAGRGAEVRLLDFESGLTAALYPRVAVFLAGDKMLGRFVVKSISVNKGVTPEELR